MREEVIKADTIDVAVERILDVLKNTSRREKFIYFDGWDGLGASAVLQVLAQRLASNKKTGPPGLQFDQVIHIDCSKWESTRAVQREIIKQLKLPSRVMEMFDKQDEEDDFNGIQGARAEIPVIGAEIERSIQGRRFLLVLHNGSNEEVNIADLGLSIYGYLSSKMVWTFQGRFRMDPKMKDKAMKNNTTDILLSASRSECDQQELRSYLLREEAAQVACKHGVDPAIVVECFLYMFKLNCIRGHHVDSEYDLGKHTCNYWICDGIIQKITDSGEEAWQVGEALQGEIRLDMHYHHSDLPSHLLMYTEKRPHWTSPAYGFALVPAAVLPNGTFQHFDKLGVIKISRCSFSFSSPPFLCCHSLRFLCLDHCQDLRSTDEEQRTEEEEDSWACFQSLWVLDLRYTDCDRILSARVMDLMNQLRELNVIGAKNWDMSHLQGRLCHIRKLRVTKCTCSFNKNVLSEKESMVLLDFSGNIIRQGTTSLSGASSNSSLETVIIDGCDGLKNISFRGSKELKDLLVKGSLGSLKELDLSGTSVKTLDLRGVETKSLPKQIILLGCEKLRAILWPLKLYAMGEGQLNVRLHIDTTSPSTPVYGGDAPVADPHADRSLHQHKEEMFKGGWKISLMDTRLLRSLSPVRSYFEGSSLHIDICHAATGGGINIQGTSNAQPVRAQPHTSPIAYKYRDVLRDGPVAAMMMWDCPKIFLRTPHKETYIIKVIMHGHGNKHGDAPSSRTGALILPDFICEKVTSLHVYNNPSITSIPAPPEGSGWINLRWCRIERCPKLHTVYTVPQDSGVNSFFCLETFWASQLLFARYVWELPVKRDLETLNFLHLEHCPRLLHVLPLTLWKEDVIHTYRLIQRATFHSLETIEIVYCGDLREVFPLSPELQEQDTTLKFPKLRRIHLHELPMLQHICGRRMSAPKLETIKIRGCWSLRHLPAVGGDTKPPKVDCEKEWWDNLEWDGLEKYHHPSLYESCHSLYYKAQLPRDSLLR